jgi:hypothetical protein
MGLVKQGLKRIPDAQLSAKLEGHSPGKALSLNDTLKPRNCSKAILIFSRSRLLRQSKIHLDCPISFGRSNGFIPLKPG